MTESEPVKIRRLFLHEAEEVYQIEKQSFDGAVWPLEAFIEEAADERAVYYVAVLAGKIIGYAGIWVIIDEIHLNNIAVLPQHRGTGVATALMDAVIAYGQSRGADKMTLEVSCNNTAGLALYRKYGFEAEGERRNYYGPGEHAVIMWQRRLPGSAGCCVGENNAGIGN